MLSENLFVFFAYDLKQQQYSLLWTFHQIMKQFDPSIQLNQRACFDIVSFADANVSCYTFPKVITHHNNQVNMRDKYTAA